MKECGSTVYTAPIYYLAECPFSDSDVRGHPLALLARSAYACGMAREDCTVCGGTGWKVVERATDGAQALSSDRPGASAGDPKMVWAVPCDCTTGDRTERLLARARVPERYRHCDFDNFEADNEIEGVSREQAQIWNRSLGQAKLVVQRFAEEFSPIREMQTEPGLLLMGACGAGKTHLAVAALEEHRAAGP